MRTNVKLAVLLAVATACKSLPALATPCERMPPFTSNATVTLPSTAETVRVPSTALVTMATDEVREGTIRVGNTSTAMLLLRRGETTAALAAVSTTAAPHPRRVQLFDRSGLGEADALVRLTTLEHLYAFLLRQDPLERYIFGPGSAPRATLGERAMSHGATLARVAAARECVARAVADRHPEVPIKPWKTARIEVRASPAMPQLQVSARVMDEAGRPLAGHLTFGRGHHLACSAPLDRAGVGVCTLFDSHGHELHDHDMRGPTFVTFSGSVLADRVVLPMTAVYSAAGHR